MTVNTELITAIVANVGALVIVLSQLMRTAHKLEQGLDSVGQRLNDVDKRLVVVETRMYDLMKGEHNA